MNLERADQMYDRAEEILSGLRCGIGESILWHLALRRHADGMLALAARVAQGKAIDSFSGIGLERRAFRLGSARAAQHLAITYFNQNDLPGYRLWLHRGARLGDQEAVAELHRFETRLTHGDARRIRRLRPARAADGYWRPNRRASKPTKWYAPRSFSIAG